jgi:ribosomal protein S4
MVFFNKYNKYSKKLLFLNNFPIKKILSFKRSKWKKFKLKFKIKKHKLKFFNLSKKNSKISFWEKLKKTYGTGLILKNSIQKYYNNALSLTYLKKKRKEKKSLALKYLVDPLLKLDVFLWKLQIFSSIREINQYIRGKKILVNNVLINKVRFLKFGDILKLPGLDFNRPSFKYNISFFFSFCELDFYTNTFIIFKNTKYFNVKDYFFIFQYKKINLKNLEFYLSKK